jgi:hypothetical protein
MALLFVLKKKFKGGISLSDIEVRSLVKNNSGPGVLKLDYRGVSVVIGLPISMNYFPSTICEVLVEVSGDKGGTIYFYFRSVSD